jgi:glycerol-3-phosphate acyltransferase PlsX
MGGDNAPVETVRGAVEAVRADPDLAVCLVGDRAVIEPELARGDGPRDRLEIVHATQVIRGHEAPVEALKSRPDASIKRAAELLKAGAADGLVAAGSTGATVAAATLILKLIPTVRRPGIAVMLPAAGGRHTVLCDAGANIHCRALHLYHYGIMAAQYAQDYLGRDNPRVGLLNVASEEGKGTDLVKETLSLFGRSPVNLNFVGNVEGNDVFGRTCDVIVCEGFVGNVVLKTAEGLFETIAGSMAELHKETEAVSPERGEMLGSMMRQFQQRMDWAEYGGAPLLGVNGLVLISHGRSDARAVRNALLQASRLHGAKVLQHMTEDLRAS